MGKDSGDSFDSSVSDISGRDSGDGGGGGDSPAAGGESVDRSSSADSTSSDSFDFSSRDVQDPGAFGASQDTTFDPGTEPVDRTSTGATDPSGAGAGVGDGALAGGGLTGDLSGAGGGPTDTGGTGTTPDAASGLVDRTGLTGADTGLASDGGLLSYLQSDAFRNAFDQSQAASQAAQGAELAAATGTRGAPMLAAAGGGPAGLDPLAPVGASDVLALNAPGLLGTGATAAASPAASAALPNAAAAVGAQTTGGAIPPDPNQPVLPQQRDQLPSAPPGIREPPAPGAGAPGAQGVPTGSEELGGPDYQSISPTEAQQSLSGGLHKGLPGGFLGELAPGGGYYEPPNMAPFGFPDEFLTPQAQPDQVQRVVELGTSDVPLATAQGAAVVPGLDALKSLGINPATGSYGTNFNPGQAAAGAASLRLNNPGAMTTGGSWLTQGGQVAQEFGGTAPQNLPGGGATPAFGNPISGAAANFANQTRNIFGAPNETVSESLRQWGEGNDLNATLGRIGIQADTRMRDIIGTPDQTRLMQSMAQTEAGRQNTLGAPAGYEQNAWENAASMGLGPFGNIQGVTHQAIVPRDVTKETADIPGGIGAAAPVPPGEQESEAGPRPVTTVPGSVAGGSDLPTYTGPDSMIQQGSLGNYVPDFNLAPLGPPTTFTGPPSTPGLMSEDINPRLGLPEGGPLYPTSTLASPTLAGLESELGPASTSAVVPPTTTSNLPFDLGGVPGFAVRNPTVLPGDLGPGTSFAPIPGGFPNLNVTGEPQPGTGRSLFPPQFGPRFPGEALGGTSIPAGPNIDQPENVPGGFAAPDPWNLESAVPFRAPATFQPLPGPAPGAPGFAQPFQPNVTQPFQQPSLEEIQGAFAPQFGPFAPTGPTPVRTEPIPGPAPGMPGTATPPSAPPTTTLPAAPAESQPSTPGPAPVPSGAPGGPQPPASAPQVARAFRDLSGPAGPQFTFGNAGLTAGQMAGITGALQQNPQLQQAVVNSAAQQNPAVAQLSPQQQQQLAAMQLGLYNQWAQILLNQGIQNPMQSPQWQQVVQIVNQQTAAAFGQPATRAA